MYKRIESKKAGTIAPKTAPTGSGWLRPNGLIIQPLLQGSVGVKPCVMLNFCQKIKYKRMLQDELQHYEPAVNDLFDCR